MPKEYRRKPDTVLAGRLSKDNVEHVAVWCGGKQIEEINPTDSSDRYVALNVPTMNGIERASEGDFIIKNSRGEISVQQAGSFLYEYEEA